MVEASLTILMADKALQAFIGLLGLILGMRYMDDPDGVMIIFLLSQVLAIAVTSVTVRLLATLI